MESRLQSVNDHEQVPVSIVNVSGFAKIQLLLLVLLVETAVFATVVRIAVINIGITSVVESLERCSNSTESLIEFLVTRSEKRQSEPAQYGTEGDTYL